MKDTGVVGCVGEAVLCKSGVNKIKQLLDGEWSRSAFSYRLVESERRAFFCKSAIGRINCSRV